MRNSRHRDSEEALDKACSCYTCSNFSRSYLHHLDKCNEILSSTLNTIHNVHFYQQHMHNMRTAILHNTLDEFAKEFYASQVDPNDV